MPRHLRGRDNTFYFAEVSGFPASPAAPLSSLRRAHAAEHNGIELTTFPRRHFNGSREPGHWRRSWLATPSNEPNGPFVPKTMPPLEGCHQTPTSLRAVDHRNSDQATLFTRFSLTT